MTDATAKAFELRPVKFSRLTRRGVLMGLTAPQLVALGIAILGTVLFSSTAGILSSSLDDRGVPAAERDQIVSAVVDSAGAAIAGLEQKPQTADAAADAKAAFSDGTRLSAFTAAGFLAIGLLATIPLGRASRRERVEAEV